MRMLFNESRKEVGNEMTQRKELRRQFEEVPIEAGVYEVKKNTENQKILHRQNAEPGDFERHETHFEHGGEQH